MQEYKLPVRSAVWMKITALDGPINQTVNLELWFGTKPNTPSEKIKFADLSLNPGESVIFEIDTFRYGPNIFIDEVISGNGYHISDSIFKMSN